MNQGARNPALKRLDAFMGEWRMEVGLSSPSAGTLQGNWFNGTAEQTNGNITKMLALAHENYDPTIGAISIGGTIAQRAEWRFDPTHTGTVNREFSEVTPGDSIYCYQASGMAGRVLIQLVTETTLTIEHQSGSCTANVAFVSPFSYQR